MKFDQRRFLLSLFFTLAAPACWATTPWDYFRSLPASWSQIPSADQFALIERIKVERVYSSGDHPEVDKVTSLFAETLLQSAARPEVCGAFAQEPMTVSNVFGVPGGEARRLIALCPDSRSTGQKRTRRWSYVLLRNGADLPVVSWSTVNNESFLMIGPKTSWLDLYLEFTHELAVSLDGHNQNYFPRVLQKMGIAENLAYHDGGEVRYLSIRKVTFLPMIKFTFAALRGMQLERLAVNLPVIDDDQVLLDEAGRYFAALQTWQGAMINDSSSFLEDMLAPEAKASVILDKPQFDAVFTILSKIENGPEIANPLPIDIFAGTGLNEGHQRKFRSLFAYLTDPVLIANGAAYSKGPKPRIGPGVGSEIPKEILRSLVINPARSPEVAQLLRELKDKNTELELKLTPPGSR